MLTMDNTKEFIQGEMQQEMRARSTQAKLSLPYSPNKSPWNDGLAPSQKEHAVFYIYLDYTATSS